MNATNNSGVAPDAALSTLRATAAALIAAPIVLAVVLTSMNLDGDGPPAWGLAVGPLVTLAGVVFAQVVGYPGHRRLDGELSGTRFDASPEATGTAARQVFQSAFFLRFALAEAGMVLAFVLTVALGSMLPYLLALCIGLPGLVWHLWPSRSLIERCAARLEDDGRPSYLREGFGLR